jgi:hypothetical protein
MRTLVFTLLLGLIVGACSLVFDAKGSSSNSGPDELLPDAAQQSADADPGNGDAGHTDDAGCNPDPVDASTTDADVPADASFPSDADIAEPDGGGWHPDAAW